MFLTFIVSWLLPWWSYLLVSVFIGWFSKSGARAFGIGFLGTGLVWIMAAYYQDLRSESIISKRLAEMFGLPHPILIYLVLWVVVGVSSGLFCVLGFYLAELAQLRQQRVDRATQSLKL